ncbi:MAG: hypothetical protein Q4B71_05840 [Cardiobacteriaceae bacterium]|nr:hypothetical protein [Cardiobacteriaceae bacterium]
MQNLFIWFLFYVLDCLFFYWVIFGGGADFFERYDALWCWFGNWTSESIKLWAGFIWLLKTLWFLLGLIKPEYRLG